MRIGAKTACIGIGGALALFAPAISLAATVNVAVGDDYFSPPSVTVQAGDTVVWTNGGSIPHTVTADDGSFDSGTLSPGRTYLHTFPRAGTFSYHCAFHGAAGGVGMAGTIGAAAAAGQPTLAVTGASGGASLAQLQTEVAALAKYLAELQAQKGSEQAPASASCPSITSQLGPGDSGVAVMQLQAVLSSAGFFHHALTMYYGPVTTAAVQRFQADRGIVGSGSPRTSGYGRVGSKTLAAIKSLCAQSAGDLNNTSLVVGAFMQVSPTSGTAPLTVNVEATVNTTNSCGSAVYTLDWGDGSQRVSIPVAIGTCQPLQQTYTHTYADPAAYRITLSAGDHSSEATVVVQP